MKKIYANGTDEAAFLCDLKKRSGETNKKVEAVVTEIIETIKTAETQSLKFVTV